VVAEVLSSFSFDLLYGRLFVYLCETNAINQ